MHLRTTELFSPISRVRCSLSPQPHDHFVNARPQLVLAIGDAHIPWRASALPERFKRILVRCRVGVPCWPHTAAGASTAVGAPRGDACSACDGWQHTP